MVKNKYSLKPDPVCGKQFVCVGNSNREVWRRFQTHLRPQRPRRRAVVTQI